MTEVRTRFAPSPTGFLHVGSARTAFFSYLLARHFGGKFLLRVEDTDQERSVPGAIKSLVEELAWLGITIDEGPSRDELAKVGEPLDGIPEIGGPCGPYIQSLRLPRYKEVSEELIRLGAAYRCDCTPEMLERERLEQAARKETPGYSGYCRDRNVSADTKHVVRFKMPYRKPVTLMDAVKGRVHWDSIPLRDTVLLKSDGFPTYHLAVVADDHDMRISHVLRGDEWLSTAPLHVLLYEALGWEQPTFAHLPVIKGPNGKKLSKREGSVFTSIFREEGYLPDALLNFVTLIGWSVGEGSEQEILSRAELIEKFTLQGINPASGVFDYGKLAWMNGMYIRKLSLEEFTKQCEPFIAKAGLKISPERWNAVAALVQERVKLLSEVPAMIDFLCVDSVSAKLDDMLAKDVDHEKAKTILVRSAENLNALQQFDHAGIETALRPFVEEFKVKAGSLFGVLRVAITGKKIAPPLFESMAALGKEETVKRIEAAIPR